MTKIITDYDFGVMRKNSEWLAEQLGAYTERFSPDGGRTVPHVGCVGYLRRYSSKRFFTKERVLAGCDPTTEQWIEQAFEKEKQDKALNALHNIYEELRNRVPKPDAKNHQFL